MLSKFYLATGLGTVIDDDSGDIPILPGIALIVAVCFILYYSYKRHTHIRKLMKKNDKGSLRVAPVVCKAEDRSTSCDPEGSPKAKIT